MYYLRKTSIIAYFKARLVFQFRIHERTRCDRSEKLEKLPVWSGPSHKKDTTKEDRNKNVWGNFCWIVISRKTMTFHRFKLSVIYLSSSSCYSWTSSLTKEQREKLLCHYNMDSLWNVINKRHGISMFNNLKNTPHINAESKKWALDYDVR